MEALGGVVKVWTVQAAFCMLAGSAFLYQGCASPSGEDQAVEDQTPEPSPETRADEFPLDPKDEEWEKRFKEHVRPTDPLTPEQQQKGFHLPPGFSMELFASDPRIGKPFNIAFDARGRLWLTQSLEYPFPATGGEGKDRVMILEDTDGDGQADSYTVFADGLNIPIGLIPVEDGAIVFSIPYVYRFFDIDGDDRADHKVVLYGKFGSRDTHGLVNAFTRGFDGWLYACHGYVNTSTIAGGDGSSITLTSGNTFRMAIDGSRVEQFTYGQVNPYGLSLDHLGNLYSVDCHSKPIYHLLHGADYPHFGKTEGGIGYGPEMMSHLHGSTALAGITYYAADQFPEEYRDNIFTGDAVRSRIDRDSLERHGSTQLAVAEDEFVLSDDPWFRPVDLELGPDGAIYVADFYNKIIGHYEVPLTHPERDKMSGRIWRIVYHGEDTPPQKSAADGDWSKAGVDDLIEDLGHSNLTVRMMATNQLVDRIGKSAIAPAEDLVRSEQSSPFQRIHSLWILHRLGALDPDILKQAAGDPAAEVRLHAVRILSEVDPFEDWHRELALSGVQDADPDVQREATQALRVAPHQQSLATLLDLRRRALEEDTHLIYVVRMAIRDHLRDEAIFAEAFDREWNDPDAAALADVMVGVRSEGSAAFLLDHMKSSVVDEKELVLYVEHAAIYLPESKLNSLVQWARRKNPGNVQQQRDLFKAVEAGIGERELPMTASIRSWGVVVAQQILAGAGQDEKLLRSGFEIAASLGWSPAQARLIQVLHSQDWSPATRASAAAALVSINPAKHAPRVGRLVRDAELPLAYRMQLVEPLNDSDSPQAIAELIEILGVAPKRLQHRIVGNMARKEAPRKALLDAVEAGKASAQLLLRSGVTIQFMTTKQEARFLALTEGVEPVPSDADRLIRERQETFDLASTSSEQGLEIFKEHCSKCHQIGGEGKVIGPQLDGIGSRGIERLLEDVLDPSSNVDVAFRTQIVRLKNGTSVTGFVVREESDRIIFMDDMDNERRIAKADIRNTQETKLSPMPSDFVDKVSTEDFNNLMAFLLASGD